MLRVGKKTHYEAQEVLQRAIDFFQKQNGLTLAQQSPSMVYFTGGGGHVQVTIESAPGEKTEVDIQTQEWDYDVKKFLQEI